MKKFLGTAALVLSMTVAATAAAAETMAINDNFESYVSEQGTTIPDGWKLSGNSIDGKDTAMRSVTEDGNTYIQTYASGNTHRKLRIQKTQFSASVDKDFVLKFKFMTNYPRYDEATKTTFYLENPLVEFGNCTDSAGNASQVAAMQLKNSGIIAPVGGSANSVASAEERGGVVPKYVKNHWYDMTVVSRTDGDSIRLTTYVDGVMLDTRLLSELNRLPAKLSWIQFGINDQKSNSDIMMNFDDIKLYTAYDELSLKSGDVEDGDVNVDSSKDIIYRFSNDLDPSSINTITVADSNGAVVNSTVTRVDMNGIKIHFDEILAPESTYTIQLGGLKDLLGGTLADCDISFTTKGILVGTEITSYSYDNGTVNADVKYTNPTDKKDAFAKSVIAVYDENNSLAAVDIIDVSLAASETKTEKVSIGDGNLDRNCTLKIICVKDFDSMSPSANAASQKYIGKAIVLPSDFAELPFEIYKDGTGSYSHNATVGKAFDESKALNVYISKNQVGMLGSTADAPTRINQFTANIRNNRYEGYTSFILNLVDDVVVEPILLDLEMYNISSLMIRSASPSGMSWMGQKAEISEWTKQDGNVYKTTMTNENMVLFPVNLKAVDNYGMPKAYDVVLSAEECASTEGSCYVDGQNVYVNLYNGESIDDIDIIIKNRVLDFYNWSNQTVVVDNVGFLGGQYKFQPNTTDAHLYVFNSKFYRGELNAFAVIGYYNAYVLDSVAAYGSADGFNYHSSSHDNVAVEVNCVSYGNGKYKTKTSGSQTGVTSNNGSTAHDSMKVLRVGGNYWECEGAIVADTNNCYSINIGCSARTVLPTATQARSGYSFSNAKGGADDLDYDQKKYVIDCYAGGDNLVDYGFRYDADVVNTPVIALDIVGTVNPQRPLSYTITWDDIMNGNW